MPTNKIAQLRYRLIDQCLRGGRKTCTFEQLRRRISEKLQMDYSIPPNSDGLCVSERTLCADIAHMRLPWPEGFDAPIVRKNGRIWYSDPGYSIRNNPLTPDDMAAINHALQLLGQFAGLPHYAELARMAQRLSLHFHDLHDDNPSWPIIQLEKNEILKGIQHLKPLYHHVRQRQPLHLVYHPFNFEAPFTTLFHPHFLKEYNNRWYVVGWDQQEEALRNYALDRIIKFDPAPNTPYHQPNYNPARYYDPVVGVTLLNDVSPGEIRLRAQPTLAQYIKTKPIHPSQKVITSDNTGTTFALRLIPNYELESILLSHGEHLEVLRPDSLRQKIAARLSAAAAIY